MIYLDHNASTPLRPEALEAMMPYLRNEFGNASSIHQAGQRARKAIEDARAELARFIGADSPDEIIFTAGGTESNNFAIKGAVAENRRTGRRVVSSAIEHSSVRSVLRDLVVDGDIDNVVIPVESNGMVRAKDVEDALTSDTILVSIMAANNETGVLQPVRDIAQICRERKIVFHTDAVQLGGKLPVRVNELGVDLLTLSGHKIGAAKGVGILYVRRGTRLRSLIHGGKQEKNRRAGTENVAGIVSMGVAARLTALHLDAEVEHVRKLRDEFEAQVLKAVPRAFVNGDPAHRIANTTNIAFECVDSSEMIMALDLKGVACSSGSACHAGSAEASHVLLAMGLPQDKAHSAIRFSFGHTTTEQDARTAAFAVADTVERLRKNHPLWREAVGQ